MIFINIVEQFDRYVSVAGSVLCLPEVVAVLLVCITWLICGLLQTLR